MRETITGILLFSSVISFGQSNEPDTLLGKEFQTLVVKDTRDVPKVFREEKINLDPQQTGDQLDDFLQSQTGLHIRDYGPGQLSSITFRGMNPSQTTVYWNGVEMNSAMLGQADLSVIPLSGVNQVSVRHGNANQRDGFGGIGGSVMLSSGFDTSHSDQSQLTLRAGSFQNFNGSFSQQYKLGKSFHRTLISGTSNQNRYPYKNIAVEGYPEETRENAVYKQWNIQHDAEIHGEKSVTEFHGLYSSTERNIPPVILNTDYVDEQQNDKSAVITVSHQRKIFQYWYLNLQTAYKFTELMYRDEQSDVYSNSNMHSIQNRAVANGWIGKRNQLFINGLLNYDVAYTTNYSGKTRAKTALGAQWMHYFGYHWKTMVGIRPEMYDSETALWQPSIGLVRTFWRSKIELKANFSRNVRFPTLNDLYWEPGGNPDLKPEEAQTTELGVSLNVKNWHLNVTGFYSDVKNWIQWVPGSTGFSIPENVQNVVNSGVEVGLNGNYVISKKWNISPSIQYTYANPTVDESTNVDNNTVGNQLIYTPNNKLVAGFVLNYNQFNLGVDYQFVDQRYLNQDNTWYMPEYDLLDAHIGGEIINNKWVIIQARISIKNILDKDYMVLAWRPMPGRSYQADLVVTFR